MAREAEGRSRLLRPFLLPPAPPFFYGACGELPTQTPQFFPMTCARPLVRMAAPRGAGNREAQDPPADSTQTGRPRGAARFLSPLVLLGDQRPRHLVRSRRLAVQLQKVDRDDGDDQPLEGLEDRLAQEIDRDQHPGRVEWHS
jgi:hypothetical protein